jgi:hypothetical protein
MTDNRPESPHAVHLWLTVTNPGEFYPSGKSALWHKWLIMGHTPAPGDQIELWDFGEGGVMWYVNRRDWNADGHLGLQLAAMLVDPPDRQTTPGLANPYYSSTWWTDRDGGDPIPKLTAGGWLRYGKESAA